MATMSRKFPYFLAVLFIFSVIAPPIYADDQTVFGPEVFEIDEKGVHLSIQKLNVDDHGKGFIIVTKNTPDKRIKDGFIRFDKKVKKKGKLHKKGSIRLRKFFRGKKLVFEKKIKLRHANYLTVYLKGTPEASVTIEIKKADGAIPSPVVTFSADPQSIKLGQSSTLTWTTFNAESVNIDQGIADVPLSGSLAVSPLETTTYTLTAIGPGGTTTESGTVTVYLPPTVTISAEPETIQVGESATLAWSSTHADSCIIEPGIGSVDADGSITVSPTETTTYTITATGPRGTATDSVTVTVIYPITLDITSPDDCETISRPDIMIKGTITNTTGNETGVTVNGILAIVNGDHFVANHVPLEEGENTITATATDTSGNTATASINVNAVEGNYITLSSNTESGISPLETTLKVDSSFTFTESSLTHTGPGVVEVLESTSEEYRVRMTGEGVYYFTAEVTDTEDNIYTDTVAIVVLDQAELDALLRVKWEGMKTALAQNDIDSAVSYFDDFSKDAYRKSFTSLSQLLPQIAQELGDVQFIRMMKNSVEYDIRRIRNGKEYSLYLLFVRDEDGLWKIRSF